MFQTLQQARKESIVVKIIITRIEIRNPPARIDHSLGRWVLKAGRTNGTAHLNFAARWALYDGRGPPSDLRASRQLLGPHRIEPKVFS